MKTLTKCLLVSSFICLFTFFVAGSVAAQENVTLDWVRQFGTAGEDLAQTADGNIYVVGRTVGTFSGETSSGSIDAFIRKYDIFGNIVWTRQFGTSAADLAIGVGADLSKVYVGGITNGSLPDQSSSGGVDAFLRKYDASGNVDWTRQFGTNGLDQIINVAVDSGGIYVSGLTNGAFSGQTNAGDFDVFVRKYDSLGNEVWTRQFGTNAFDLGFGISVDSSGVYVSGSVRAALPGQSALGDRDAFVRKYDTSGNEVWTRQFGTNSFDQALGVSVDSSGVYIAGFTGGTLFGQSLSGLVDAFVRKYDSLGNEVWTRQFGTNAGDTITEAWGISVDATGVYVSGLTGGNLGDQENNGQRDAFVRKYDTSGNKVWSRLIGGNSVDQSFGLSVDSTGIYVIGVTSGTLEGQSLSGPSDGFIVKYIIDSDEDNIFDSVDVLPALSSNDFTDGLTTGSITTRGNQILRIGDALDSSRGVLIAADPRGGVTPATVSACLGASSYTIGLGDQVTVTCGSVIVDVLAGTVEISFLGKDGTVATTSLAEGSSLTFDPETLTFTAPETNSVSVIVVVGGSEFTIDPGETEVAAISVEIDIKPGSDRNPINLKSKGVVPVAVLTTSIASGDGVDFDASSADAASLVFAGASLVVIDSNGKNGKIGSLEDVDGDGDLDLILHFNTEDLRLVESDSEASISGKTFSGTPIIGADSVVVN